MMLRKVISGGQTGVDRAGLDAALAAGIPVGGYCPKGRKAEDGAIPSIYPLHELDSSAYSRRTEMNVVESNGTLIFNKGHLTQGTKLTHDFTAKHLKPCLIVQLDAEQMIDPLQVIRWLQGHQIAILNVAGPRESKFSKGIYREVYSYLGKIFNTLKEAQ